MEGLYLYCIRRRIDTPFSFFRKGIDEKYEVTTFACRDLEAVISKVPLEEFDSEEIQIKAQNDMKWLREKAVIHEQVIEEAMRSEEEILPLIPMKFGTIFKEEKGLRENIDEHYEQFRTILEKLQGKQEWNIKVYLTNKKKLEEVIKGTEAIKEKEKEIASMPEGMAYFMEEELKELLGKEIDRELKKTSEVLFERFEKIAEEVVEGKILDQALTQREHMVLNTSYLVKKERIEDFKVEAVWVKQEIEAKGFTLEHSGPWPPYNFIS
ncbi:hypothetical protein AUJ66_06780 [Candidatus Desantisbacteria bacterium CG1_02_38_46]|uniref:Gas vesicle synthesis GvpLGvpF n=1 Tax=Candidatus Desantisbacteria bacterium CG1_02_38_46 TaxID=1817893 RepID=A0A1J4SDT9_9BACT|nr:MAG: hypothetical protein AUJ66_06780 [Candidatus Desantisbacteria bacterium CG1_02_38_46]